jgi:hypothetical protein
VHALPQVPQFVTVWRLASQPLSMLPSQLPVCGLQVIEHSPEMHDAWPPTLLHTCPHVPQLDVFVFRLASQPLFALLSQLANPGLQTGVHTPPAHEVVPLGLVQAFAHVPQRSVVSSGVSHPSIAFESQSPHPARHTGVHRPATHDVVPWALVHFIPHEPQLFVLVPVVVSHPFFGSASQSPYPVLQTGVQSPPTHDVVPFALEHATPHAPQFAALVFVSVSQPLPTLPSQFPQPDRQAMLQAPSEHDGVPLVLEQLLPQVPQFERLVWVLVSQPLASWPSQLPQPLLQATIWHVPVAQNAVALSNAHGTPQEPQFARVVRLVSHPFAELPSQSPNPVEHAAQPQAPPVQLGVPDGQVQTWPHVAQWFTLEFNAVSQPLPGLPSQSSNPVAQDGTQTPETHAVVPFALKHATPHAPQSTAVVSDFSHPLLESPSQLPKPLAHTGAQLPAMHDVVPCSFAQVAPQAPQCAAVLCRSVSHPLAGLASQLPNPAEHDGMHPPATQVIVPCAFVQARPHAPQFEVVVSETSHPVLALLSQSANPVLHAIAHTPAEHEGVPLFPLQAAPHALQWLVLVAVFVSQPLLVSASQLPKPALHETIEHVPVVHAAVALAGSQATPQAPQSVTVASDFSQPFEATASQFPHPVLHE